MDEYQALMRELEVERRRRPTAPPPDPGKDGPSALFLEHERTRLLDEYGDESEVALRLLRGA